MRWLGLVVLGACQFEHGALPSGDARSDAVDAPATDVAVTSPDAPDASPDTPPQTTARVRLIDLDDTKISGGPHADFPLLVSISETWLRPQSSGGDVARSDGFDIFFSADQAGAVPLAHEVELYAPGTGTLVAWVKIPLLAPQTVLYLHYGDTTITTDQSNRTAVWSGGFELVLHLDAIADATGKTTSFSSVSGGTTAGRIGQARIFDGVMSRIDLGSGTALDNVFTAGGTAEAWFFAESFGESSYGRLFEKGNDFGWALAVNNNDATQSLSFVHGSGSNGWGQWDAPANSVVLASWHHVALVYDKDSSANNPQIFIDGASVAVTRSMAPSGAMDSDGANDLIIGNRPTIDRTFDGQLDEMRLSSVSRSADWIATGYRNQVDPGTFYTLGAPL